MCSFARLCPAILALAFVAPAGLAEVVVSKSPATARASLEPPEKDIPAAISQRQVTDSPTLRCWQEGRLVIEQNGVALAEKPAGAHVFRRKGSNGVPVYVFDMKNGLCILSNEVVAAEPSR